MGRAVIKLLYRQVIEANSESFFGKSVWKASYEEFLLKSQAYNPDGKYATFQQMVAKDGRANSLHYKCGFAAAGFIETLHKKIPELSDSLGRAIAFAAHEFKVIESDINNKEAHQVAIYYTTPALVCYDSIGNYMVLSFAEETVAASPAETFVLEMQPNLSVSHYQPL